MLEGLSKEIEKHPALIALAVLVVALLAYLQAKNSPPSAQSVTFAGGGAARGIDPEAAAIEQSAISAGVANLGTIAQLVAEQDTNRTALTGHLADTSAAERTSLAGIAANQETADAATAAGVTVAGYNRDVSLAGISAQQATTLAGISATQETTDAQTAAGVTIASGNNATTLQAAQINAATQAAAIAAQSDAQKRADANQAFSIQAQKDIARANANSNIVNGIFNTIGNVVSSLNPFHWHF